MTMELVLAIGSVLLMIPIAWAGSRATRAAWARYAERTGVTEVDAALVRDLTWMREVGRLYGHVSEWPEEVRAEFERREAAFRALDPKGKSDRYWRRVRGVQALGLVLMIAGLVLVISAGARLAR